MFCWLEVLLFGFKFQGQDHWVDFDTMFCWTFCEHTLCPMRYYQTERESKRGVCVCVCVCVCVQRKRAYSVLYAINACGSGIFHND